MSLAQFSIDDGPHNMDGLRLFARDGAERIEAFVGRKVLDVWAESVEHRGGRQSLFRHQYNALWQAEPCRASADREREIPARRCVQPTASLCRGVVLGHHGKRRASKSNRTRARTLAAGVS